MNEVKPIRNKMLVVRLTPKEKSLFESYCTDKSFTPSECIRTFITDQVSDEPRRTWTSHRR